MCKWHVEDSKFTSPASPTKGSEKDSDVKDLIWRPKDATARGKNSKVRWTKGLIHQKTASSVRNSVVEHLEGSRCNPQHVQ